MRAYLDHAATSPPRPEAVAAMAEVLARPLGNASALHRSGREARQLLDDARDALAAVLGAAPGEVVFTSGGTESDHLAIVGAAAARPGSTRCSAAEHAAVRAAVAATGGTLLPVTERGVIDLDELARALGPDTAVISVMAVNNETGAISDLDAVADLRDARAPGAVLHTDAVQAVPWLDVAAVTRRADLVSVSGHKFGAPVGVGALVVRAGTPLRAVMRGGGQERERRGGTPNVAGAVALAAAATAAAAARDEAVERVGKLRDRLAEGLARQIPGLVEPAAPDGMRDGLAAGTLLVCIPDVESEALLFLLSEAGVDASAGSACASGALEPSHVLAAMGVDEALARGALRLSLGHDTDDAAIDHALAVIPDAVAQLRGAR